MKRILVIQTASLGDVILSTALLESLHHGYPAAEFDLLIKKGNESLFTGHPFLRKVIVWDKHREKYAGMFRIIGQLRRNHYDLTVNIQRFFSSGWITMLSGSRETVGFSKNPLSCFFSRRVKHHIGGSFHEVDRNQALIGGMVPAGASNPRLYPQPSDETFVEQWITGKYYTLSPASLWFTKQYPADCWTELMQAMPGDARVFLLGSAADRTLCEKIREKAGQPNVCNLAGQLSFLQSAALMRHAKMNFTNDSAPMHLASAVNAPVTAIFCSTLPGFGFGPRSSDSAIVQVDFPLPCRPCGLHGKTACPEGHFRCAFGIDPDRLAGRL